MTITSPSQDAEVDATVTITGTCRSGVAITLGGSGLQGPSTVACAAGTFATTVAFSESDGTKLLTVTQGPVSITRTFHRVTPAKLRSSSVATQGSQGSTVDCDLVIARPFEVHAGDLVFGMIYADTGNTGTVSTPDFQRTGLDKFSHVAFWKVAAQDEPTAYTFHVVAGTGGGDTCESAGVLLAFSGVASTPILAESAVFDSNDASVVAPGVTTPKRGVLVAAWGSNGPMPGFAQTGMEIGAMAVSPGDFANVLVAFQGVQPGPTGDRTATLPATRAAAAGLFVLDGKP
ncbi:MAG: hypothetical protein M4D80_36095 [Myxococcota bacterium]|nr:hypothetical protein [Myxococcota bacterium]